MIAVAQTWHERLNQLLHGYDEGVYTEGEAASLVTDLFDRGNARQLWEMLPDWLQERVKANVSHFSATDEVVVFGDENPQAVLEQILFVKSWLQANDILQGEKPMGAALLERHLNSPKTHQNLIKCHQKAAFR